MKSLKKPIDKDGVVEKYLGRANHESLLAHALVLLSEDEVIKQTLELDVQQTFYSNAISTSYFSIFYAAKAYLLSKGIKTNTPREHEKTYERFSWFVETGVLDKELLVIYEDAKLKAETLLTIFKEEKGKRGKFTYRKLSQANKVPAEQSVKNARKFFAAMYMLVKG